MWAVFIAFAFNLVATTTARAEPFVPESDSEVVEQLRDRPLDRSDRELRQLRAALRRSPKQLPLAISVAQRCLQMARRNGDPRYTGYAEAALAPWWNLSDAPTAVRLLKAIVMQSVHQFSPALEELDNLAHIDPSNAQVWMTRASIFQVQGRYSEAKSDCEQLGALGRTVYSEACLSDLQGLTGDAEAAYAHLEQLRQQNTPLAGWLNLMEAELMERQGHWREADRHFQDAVGANDDAYTRGAYADFLLDQSRPDEVIALLEGSERVDPLLLRLALAYQQRQDARLAGAVRTLQARFDAARLRGDAVHMREEARFDLELVHDRPRALQLAVENWQIQKEPADLRILLACARASRRDPEAAPAKAFIARNHLADVRLATYLK
jgi:tetratricopeptide (TPR) repeat protein